MGMTLYQQKALLDFELGKAAYTPPAELYLLLLTADPTEAGSLTNELPNASNYARVAILAAMDEADVSTGLATNISTITFPTPSADWDAATHFGLSDSATIGAGNMRYFGELSTAVIGLSGVPLYFTAGQFSIDLDDQG